MIPAMTLAERTADRIIRVGDRIVGHPTSVRAIRLAPWLHQRRDYIILRKSEHTSHGYQSRTGGPEKIPAGEHMTLYYLRGYVYRFWRGECASVDACIEPELHERYVWDGEKYGVKQGGGE